MSKTEQSIVKTFTITTSPRIMRRIERFLALLHYNTRFGHSGIFGMSLDGDGPEQVTVSPKPAYAHEVDAIGGVGYEVEVAYDGSYSGVFQDHDKDSRYVVRKSASLYVDGKSVKTIPSCLGTYIEEE